MREEKPKTGLPALPSPASGRSGAFSTSWNRRGQHQNSIRHRNLPGERSLVLSKKRRR